MIDKIGITKLPLNGDVLRRLFHLTYGKKTIKEALNIAYSEILENWDGKYTLYVLTKLKRKYDQYRTLQRTKFPRNQIQIANKIKMTYLILLIKMHCK